MVMGLAGSSCLFVSRPFVTTFWEGLFYIGPPSAAIAGKLELEALELLTMSSQVFDPKRPC